MTKIKVFTKLIICSSIFLVSTVFAADQVPSDESLKELLAVSEAAKVIDSYFVQVDSMMKSGVQQATAGQPLNAAQQKIMDETQAKTMEVFRSEMTWEKMQPIFLKVYKENLTQEEVDGIVEFYKSPAGKALVKKMPVVMQATASNMQVIMQSMIPKLDKIQQESVAKMKEKATK